MNENPLIRWEPEVNYDESTAETAAFVLSVSNAVADRFGYLKEELYLANFRDNHRLVLEYEEEGENEANRLEQGWNEPVTLEQYKDLLENVGADNVTDIYVSESRPAISESELALGSTWNYESVERPLQFLLTSEDEIFDTGSDDNVGFSGMFSVMPYAIEKETFEKERETIINNLKKSLGFEPETYEITNVIKRGPRHEFMFMQQPLGGSGPHMGEVKRDRVEAVYDEVKESDRYSLENL